MPTPAVQVLIYVVQGARVGRDRLFGSMAVYLLIGFVWALLCAIVEASIPGSFQGLRDPGSVTSTASDLFYFSFVTLTITGFGDISPVSPQARTWAVLESVTGVLYIATLAARLVGLYGRDDRYE